MNVLKSIGITIIAVAIWISSMLLGYIFAVLGTIMFIGFVSYQLIISSKKEEDKELFKNYFDKENKLI